MRQHLLTVLLLTASLTPLLPAQDAPTDPPPPATMPRPRRAPAQFGGATTLPSGPACPLDATIYDLRIPPAKTASLDAAALAQSADTPDHFEKALAALGTAKPLYRTHQSVRLGGDTIVIGTQVPYIVNSRTTDAGQTVNTVAYRQVGAIFHINGTAPSPTSLDLDLRIEASNLTDGKTPITDKVNAPQFRTIQLAQKGPATPNQPILLFSIDAASTDSDGNAVVTLARLTLGTPAQPPATAPSK